MYPRRDENGRLVEESQMVFFKEHLHRQHRVISLDGEITGAMSLTEALLAMDSVNHEPIKVIITSPGGLLDGAFFVCDVFRLIESPVYTIGRFCASAATLLLATGNKRYVFPHAVTMLHLPSAMLAGDSRDLDIQRIEIEKKQDAIITLLQEQGVKKSKGEILKDIDRDYWMNPKEAITYGLADEVVTSDMLRTWLGGKD